MPRKFFIIAGEASGDSHGSRLVRELKKKEPDLEFVGLGGPKMQAEGVLLLEDMTRLSVLGLGDVLRKYFVYRKIFYRALEEIRRLRPDAVILIDSPAFNLRLAKKIRKRFPVIYYISPQIWAWGKRRIHTIKKIVHKMLVILPFEVELYQKAGIPCEFVGHPLLDHVQPSADRKTLRRRLEILDDDLAVGLLAGSRQTEVERILPLMLQSARELKTHLPRAVYFLATAPNVQSSVYDKILNQYPDIRARRIDGNLYDLITALDFALITSGTTTLEAALLGTPFFLFYKASWSTYILGKQLIRVPYLGLVNLLTDRRVVPEFIQYDIHPVTIAHEAKVLLQNRDLYERMKEDFREARAKLGEPGASYRAAQSILEFLGKASVSSLR
jgi:lipid-A-disaccharide synthase